MLELIAAEEDVEVTGGAPADERSGSSDRTTEGGATYEAATTPGRGGGLRGPRVPRRRGGRRPRPARPRSAPRALRGEPGAEHRPLRRALGAGGRGPHGDPAKIGRAHV